jgi:integrase
MPWKESSVMNERLRFVARLLEGEPMSHVCREFGISRKTGYKIFGRYKEHGLEALSDRSRRPVRYANQLPSQVETAIVRAKEDKPGRTTRNPADRIGSMIRSTDRRTAGEVRRIETWSRTESEALLAVAREHELRFAPVFHVLLATGVRRGEALALRWEDVNFSSRQIAIRRAITHRRLTTPKSGKARTVAMAGGLARGTTVGLLLRGWNWDERNVERSWDRVRRRAQEVGVRPLKLHSARHSFATLTLEAGRSVRWAAEQLGYSDPVLTLRVYAHALRSTEADLTFVDFG